MGRVCKHYTIKQCKDFDECGYMHEEVMKLPVAAIRLEINVQQGGAERERDSFLHKVAGSHSHYTAWCSQIPITCIPTAKHVCTHNIHNAKT